MGFGAVAQAVINAITAKVPADGERFARMMASASGLRSDHHLR
jgi:hypothetical protein